MRSKPKLRTIAILIILAALLWFFQDQVIDALEPISSFFYRTNLQGISFFEFLSKIPRLAQENQSLRQENLALRAQLAQLKGVVQENELLRQQLALPSQPPKKFILASVISKSPGNLTEYIFINRGRLDGLAKGMGVIMPGNILVGQISKVFPNTAQVQLITDINSKIAASTLETGIQGLVKGRYGWGAIFETQDLTFKELALGKTVVTSFLNENLPQGLVLGEIIGFLKKKGPFLPPEFKVRPAFLQSELERVFIILEF